MAGKMIRFDLFAPFEVTALHEYAAMAMSYTEVRFASIRIPRIQPRIANKFDLELYALFGYRADVMARNSESPAFTIISDANDDGDYILEEFDHLTSAVAEHDPAGLPVTRLTPMEYAEIPNSWEGTSGIETVYNALGIDYRVIICNPDKYVVLVEYFDYVMRLITAARRADPNGSEPLKPRAVRISENVDEGDEHGDSLPVPATVKFADVYDRHPPHMMALAEMFGAKYVGVKFYHVGVAAHVSGDKTVYILEGLGSTVEERAKAYLEGPLAKEAAKIGGRFELRAESTEAERVNTFNTWLRRNPPPGDLGLENSCICEGHPCICGDI